MARSVPWKAGAQSAFSAPKNTKGRLVMPTNFSAAYRFQGIPIGTLVLVKRVGWVSGDQPPKPQPEVSGLSFLLGIGVVSDLAKKPIAFPVCVRIDPIGCQP
jgi:hypothetical protein